MSTRFYHFSQNNSGGSFDVQPNEGIDVNVIIEAPSAPEANTIAEGIGIYFNGCSTGIDCSCCGDRWYKVDYYEGSEKPGIYGNPFEKDDSHSGYIHYLNGEIQAIEDYILSL